MRTQPLKEALTKYGFDGAIGGGRRDEEQSRAKERVFSFRDRQHRWDPRNQRPELWSVYNTWKKSDECLRVFPLSNWTELDVWQYILQEQIPIVPLYFAKPRPVVERDGDLIVVDDDRMRLRDGETPEIKTVRFRTLGCYPITGAIESDATTVQGIVHELLMFDPYRRNRHTGAFILVDRITNETVAACMLLDPDKDSDGEEHWDDQPNADLQRAVSLISDEDRKQNYGHSPFTLLITGLSGAGKTSLALALEKLLFDLGNKCVVLDGQSMWFGLSRDLGFSAEERSENLRRAAEVCKMLSDSGIICIASFVAPHEDVRDKAKKLIGRDRTIHIHLSTPLEICRKRDQTGRYLAAEQGEIANFPGVSSGYESPSQADLQIDTSDVNVEGEVDQVICLLNNRGWICCKHATLWKPKDATDPKLPA